MRLAERVNLDIADLDSDMQFLRQLGVTDLGLMIKPWDKQFGERPHWYETPASGLRLSEYMHVEDLVAARDWVESYGLRLYSIMDMRLGMGPRVRPGEVEYVRKIDNIKKTIRNMGEAGIPQLAGGSRGFAGVDVKSPFGLNHWRTSVEAGRGGAKVVRFDLETVKSAPMDPVAPVPVEEIWADTEHFLDEVTPVAEAAGVTICHHPADPPLPMLAGVAKILCDISDYDRLFRTFPGDTNKMIFCLGCFSQMLDPEGVYGAIRHFGDKIAEVHFRNVLGDMNDFTEVYPDEGKLDMVEVVRALKDIGYDGPVVVDHTPKGVGDTAYGHRGRAFAFGYIKGLLQSAGAIR